MQCRDLLGGKGGGWGARKGGVAMLNTNHLSGFEPDLPNRCVMKTVEIFPVN